MAGHTVNGFAPNVVADAVIKLQPKINRFQAEEIAKAVQEVYADGTCKVPWQLVVSIAFHESTFRIAAVNQKTKDYGFMQISTANIERMNLDKYRLMRDYKYSLKAACKILSYNQNKYSGKVTYWLGLYRSGNALWQEKIRDNAIEYDKMVRQTASRLGYRGYNRNLAKAK